MLMTATVSQLSPPPTRPSLASRVTALVRDVGDLARDHLELAALEAQRAAIGLTKVLSAAVIVSILVVTAWLSFVASGIVWATDAGVSWPLALGIAGILNLALAAGIVFWMRSQTGEMVFSATVRQLRRTADEAKEELT
jgi:hypothetical protein